MWVGCRKHQKRLSFCKGGKKIIQAWIMIIKITCSAAGQKAHNIPSSQWYKGRWLLSICEGMHGKHSNQRAPGCNDCCRESLTTWRLKGKTGQSIQRATKETRFLTCKAEHLSQHLFWKWLTTPFKIKNRCASARSLNSTMIKNCFS